MLSAAILVVVGRAWSHDCDFLGIGMRRNVFV